MCLRDRRMVREVLEWICEAARRLGVKPKELYSMLTTLERFGVWPSDEDLNRLRRVMDMGISMKEAAQFLVLMLKSGATFDEALNALEDTAKRVVAEIGSSIAVKHWGNRLIMALRRFIKRENFAEIDVV